MEQTKLTLGRTAEMAGTSKQTLSRWINQGKVSQAAKQDDGSYLIDASELDRIKDLVKKSKARNSNRDAKSERSETFDETHELRLKISQLEEAIKYKDQLLTDKNATLSDLRTERDHWREEARQQRLLLTDGRGEDDELRSVVTQLQERLDTLSQPKPPWWQFWKTA